jgi:hypothetical protein
MKSIGKISSLSWQLFTLAFFLSLLILTSCEKSENNNPLPGEQVWMRALPDTILASTDDEIFLGRNGKVVTDILDNIYLYYYKIDLRQTIVIKCDNNGNVVWRNVISDCEPMDMVLANDNLILAVRLSSLNPKGLVLYSIQPNGQYDSHIFNPDNSNSQISVSNSSITYLDDKSFIISGAINQQFFSNTVVYNYGYILKLSSNFVQEWCQLLNDNTLSASFKNANFQQNSVIKTTNNKYLFEYSIGAYPEFADSLGYGFLTGLLNANGTIDQYTMHATGFHVKSNGSRSGFYNHYADKIIFANGASVFHYSCPEKFLNLQLPSTNGFLFLGNDSQINDTIPFDLPSNYKIFSCAEKNGKFLISTYRNGAASGTSDYSARQTVFVYGENWIESYRFSFQSIYADFFPSIASTSDGAFIAYGKIQSFNGSNNKIVLIKWRP